MIPLSQEEVKRQKFVMDVYDFINDTDGLGVKFFNEFKKNGLVGGEFFTAKNGRDLFAKFYYEDGDKQEVIKFYITPFDIFGTDKRLAEFFKFLRKICRQEFGQEYIDACRAYDSRKKQYPSMKTYDEKKDVLLENWS